MIAPTPLAQGVPCALMRGGTSKGAVFLAADLPVDRTERDDLLLRIMGSPDPRQVDGLGGAHPLTSKVAVVSPSASPDADVDYLFLQVSVEEAVVSSSQTCGNMLAAVGPFALLRGLLPTSSPTTSLRVRLVNNGAVATLEVCTPHGAVTFDGDVAISGVPGTAARVGISVARDGAAVLPTGHVRNTVAGFEATLVDAGMPSVLVRAADLGRSGFESPTDLEADPDLVATVARIRADAFALMGLDGEPETTTTPKVVLVSPPRGGGTLATRSFIPYRVHEAIGVLGAASVAAASRIPGTVAEEVATGPEGGPVRIENPTGYLDLQVEPDPDDRLGVGDVHVVRTARLILDGRVYPGPARRTHEKEHS